MSVIIETSIGDITVDLYTDERPRCCMNFLKLCKMKYYNFSLFHTVQKNLVAQTGDPTATGRGGESIFGFMYGEQARFFDMEIVPRILHTKKGLLSMVNNGSGMHGSQFFITLADSVDYLNNKHTVFGEVAEGMDIVDKLNNAFCDEANRPHQDIRIYHTVILDDPYDDPDGMVIPPKSPPPTQEMLDSDRIPCDADIDDEGGMTVEQLNEMAAEREAKANTQILEMVGDLPDQELAPPENVLFVCKLNPVTTSDDLEIIFSRFGNVVSCEVIKDQKTGESLQYAFVEFDQQPSCEMAYFKMDNVLIDDRRIHVDFSQSVSKLKWKGKGKGVEIMNDGEAPKYVLKDTQRKSDGYDLVYAHDDIDDDSGKKEKSHKKNKKSKREESPEDWRTNQRGGRNSRRDNEKLEERRRDRHDESERGRDRHDDNDRSRERNNERRERSRERNERRYQDEDHTKRRNRNEYHSHRERRRDDNDNSDDDEGSRYRSRKETESSRRREDDGRKKYSASTRRPSYSDEEGDRYRSRKETESNSNRREDDRRNKANKSATRRQSYSDDDDDDDDTHKEKSKHKKHKSDKKKGRYSDEENSSEDEKRRRRKHRSDSEEESRRKDKKKKKKRKA